MQKLVHLLSGVLLTSLSFGQTFSDDFESYSAGTGIGTTPDWTTWSGGNTDDTPVSNIEAFSGNNSLYFENFSDPTPGDIVYDFGDEYSTGTFEIDFQMKVSGAQRAYFNLQKESTWGNAAAIEVIFQYGEITVSNTDQSYSYYYYPQNQWFNFEMNINLNTNTWEFSIDNVPFTTFTNTRNQIAGIDFYALAGASFYVDDFNYTYTPYTLPNTNLGLIDFEVQSSISGIAIHPKINIRNLGLSTINSATFEVEYNGLTFTEQVNNLNLNSLEDTTFSLINAVTLIDGLNDVIITITGVNNNGSDDDSADDALTRTTFGKIVHPDRVVLAEFPTSTTCGWCPEGNHTLQKIESKYSNYFAPVAIHMNDPMMNNQYASSVVGLSDFSNPKIGLDRFGMAPLFNTEHVFLNVVTSSPSASLHLGAEFNPNNGELKMSVTAYFLENITPGYKLGIILTEDSVVGSGSNYAQANNFSNNTDFIDEQGINWYSLSDPVPASDMIYHNVARGIYPNYNGQNGSVPNMASPGDSCTFNIIVNVPQDWNPENFTIIGFLRDPSAIINNAGKASLDEAIANGYVLTTDNFTFNYVDDLFEIFPNPTNATSELSLLTNENASVRVYDLAGNLVFEQVLNQASTVLNFADMSAGMYTVEVRTNQKVQQRKLIVQ